MQFTFWESTPVEDTGEGELAPTRNIGKAGEYIVAAELEIAGYRCTLASEGLPYDIIVEREDGELIRVQVKTMSRPATKPLPKGTPWTGYQFKPNDGRGLCDYKNVDVFAFVALDKRAAVYVRASQMLTRGIGIAEKRYLDESLRTLSLRHAIEPL